MLSLVEARRLLENARDNAGLRDCSAALGFIRFTPVGIDLQKALGIDGLAISYEVGEGPGVLRALTVVMRTCDSPRDLLVTVAGRLAANVPHLLWIVLSCDARSHLAVSVLQAEQPSPKMRALMTDHGRVSESDVQTFCALCSTATSSDSLTHLRWAEILGREAVTVRFFRALRGVIDSLSESLSPGIAGDKSRDVALVYVSRLLFLSFIETKGWLNQDHDFLSNTFIQCMASGGGYHRRVLTPLFFGTLNTPARRRAARAREFGRIPFLNGGLFGRSPSERAVRFEFPDDALGIVFGDLLTRFRFTGYEHSTDLSDSAIDPEILGRAFESLMHREARKASGAFYTPHRVVQRVADAAIETALQSGESQAAIARHLMEGTHIVSREAADVRARLLQLRFIDPACGSGAFLVYLVERISDLLSRCGDSRPRSELRRHVLANSIFGVDINPTAVWLCELRLWLSVVIDADTSDPTRVLPLPNLDRNIRIGDSLTPKRRSRPGTSQCGSVLRTRLRYIRSIGARKKLLGRTLERLERRHAMHLLEFDLQAIAAERRDILGAQRSRDLFGNRSSDEYRLRLDYLRELKRESTRMLVALREGRALPFSFDTHFPDVFADGGFDVVVGNPPWVRIHQVSRLSRNAFKKEFEICRASGWKVGATRANAGSGFSHQLDLSALFIERSLTIAKEGGSVALLVPAKLWRSLAGGSVRALISRTTHIRILEDFSGAKAIFDAATYPSLIAATRRSAISHPAQPQIRAIVHRRQQTLHWSMSPDMLALEQSSGSPWLLVPGEVRAGFDKVASSGIPLSESGFGSPLLGVKTGLNEAFVMKCADVRGDTAHLESGDRGVALEASLIRRVIKGDSIVQWTIKETNERIVWTHSTDGGPLRTLPPLAMEWFRNWRRQLYARTDFRHGKEWWRVFRTESADSSCARVVWSDISRAPRAAVIPPGDNSIPLNTCYVLRCDSEINARALAALLNSPLVASWLSQIAEPAQGGYNRYLGWTMAMVPIPRRWERSKHILADLSVRASRGDIPHGDEVFNTTLKAYGLNNDDVQDMMAWTPP